MISPDRSLRGSGLAPASVALPSQRLETLVEQRTTFAMAMCELHVFETRTTAEHVELQFEAPVVTSMLRGRKVMHERHGQEFDYVPGESLILPNNARMVIDFPDASLDMPTQCLALEIDEHFIGTIVGDLNERYPKAETGDTWMLDVDRVHLRNGPDVASAIDRIVSLGVDRDRDKDVLARLTVSELLVHLMRTQARNLLLDNADRYASRHRFAAVAAYVREHLHEPIAVERLASLSCMSRATFFRAFRNEFGMTPLEYMHRERMRRAQTYLLTTSDSVADVAMRVGFPNAHHFIAVFRRWTGSTPGTWRTRNG